MKAKGKKEILHCEDCLAYYSDGYPHVCPPWLKELVRIKNKLKNSKDNSQQDIAKLMTDDVHLG